MDAKASRWKYNSPVEKRELDIDYLGLIYLTLGGERNLVPSILGGENYDYHRPSSNCEFESCYLGFLNKDGAYQDFRDFQANHVGNALKRFEERYRKARSKDYFDSLDDLADQFRKLKENYERLAESSSRIDYKKDPAKSYLDFASDHPEIVSELDVRFSYLGYSVDYESPVDGAMGKLVTFKPKPEIDCQSYLDFLDDFYKNKANEIRHAKEGEVKDLKADYASFAGDLKELLTRYEKVGGRLSSPLPPEKAIERGAGDLGQTRHRYLSETERQQDLLGEERLGLSRSFRALMELP